MLYLKDTQYAFTANFGRFAAGHTVTAACLDNAGNPSANATVGSVIELSDGFFGVTVTFTAEFNGFIKFTDTDDSIEIYSPFTSKEIS